MTIRPRRLLWIAVGSFATGFGALSSLRHEALSTGRFDLGNMVQAVWSTANGRPLETTSLDGEQFVRLGAHFDPMLAALAPLWWVWSSPHALLALQALATALGAIPLFLLARRHLASESAALGIALAYLLSPALQWQTLSEFHAVALGTPLLLLAVWAFDIERPQVALAAVAAALLTKEHVGLVVAVLGAVYLVQRRSRAAGAVALAGVATALLALAVVIPHFSPNGSSSFFGRYDEIGGTPGGIVRKLATDPATVVGAGVESRDWGLLARLLTPLAGVPLLAPALAAAALPELGLNLLSATRTQTSIHFHYSALTLALLHAASAVGVRRLARWRRWRVERIAAGLVATSLVATVLLGPLPIWSSIPGGEDLGARAFRITEHDEVAKRALRLVPDEAAVTATNRLGAHLSERRRIFSFPRYEAARWIVVDRRDPSYLDRVSAPLQHATALARLRRDPRWRIVFAQDDVLVFRRR